MQNGEKQTSCQTNEQATTGMRIKKSDEQWNVARLVYCSEWYKRSRARHIHTSKNDHVQHSMPVNSFRFGIFGIQSDSIVPFTGTTAFDPMLLLKGYAILSTSATTPFAAPYKRQFYILHSFRYIHRTFTTIQYSPDFSIKYFAPVRFEQLTFSFSFMANV